jgi:catechol 2,3-dioxygenase-like lactoylglutathione lyase family enzyme
MTEMMTSGVHHVGLTVSKLEESASFFTGLLGWQEVRRDDDYPAIFVSDGYVILTLWKNREVPSRDFDKNRNVGLHHLALKVNSEVDLNAIYQKLVDHEVPIEFTPELLRDGPARHMMCYEPSGIRLEFIWPGE